MRGYPRANGDFGIRNYTLVIPTTGCVAELARRLADRLGANYLWHPHGCDLLETDFDYFLQQFKAVVMHPNVGHVILVTLNCSPIRKSEIASWGIKVERYNLHDFQSEDELIEEAMSKDGSILNPVEVGPLTIGVKCGGSTPAVIKQVNPAMGVFCDALIDKGGTVVVGENWEMLGAITELQERAANGRAARQIGIMGKLLEDNFRDRYHTAPPSYTPEFSLGRFAKAGTRPIQGVLAVTEKPPYPGLWILDGPNTDMAGCSALAMSHCHAILFATGTHLPMGNALCPTFKWEPDSAETDLTHCRAEEARHFEWQSHLKNMIW
jgi:altronate dehydratase large subunit